MHRAAFAYEARAKLLEHTLDLNEYAPEAIGVCGVIRSMLVIFSEWNRVLHLVWPGMYLDFDAGGAQCCHQLLIKVRDRARREFTDPSFAIACVNEQIVVNEIEINLEETSAIWNRRSRQPARCDIERHVPPMISRRAEREPDFANNLRPHVQRRIGIFPIVQRHTRPNFRPRLIIHNPANGPELRPF